MTNITVRIDESVKKEAEALFEKLGMSISGAINVFFRQAIREQAIPFQIKAKTEEERHNEYFNPYNVKILEESIAQMERGETITLTMQELKAMETGDIPQHAIDFLSKHKGNQNG
jgi:DNA-damage-inducible protein J